MIEILLLLALAMPQDPPGDHEWPTSDPLLIPLCRRPTPALCEDPLVVTPRPDDDVLAWDPVPDGDLVGYRLIVRNLGGTEIAAWSLPPLPTYFDPGVSDDDRIMSIRALDYGGRLSVNPAECLWEGGAVWDCVIEDRVICPNACSRICTASEACFFEGVEFSCCIESHHEPPGCEFCIPPVGGRTIWP